FSSSADSAPVDLTLSASSIAENSPAGTIIGALSAVDPDPNDSVTFSLVDDAGGRFAVAGSNPVATAPLDYETHHGYALTLRVADAAGETYDKNVTIAVTNVPGETITGTSGNDTIDAAASLAMRSTGEEDSISAGAGQDSIDAMAGDDTLDGGS